MKTNHALNVGAAAREFKNRRAAKTIADCGDFAGVHLRPRGQRRARGVDAATQLGPVVQQGHQPAHPFRKVLWGFAVAIHVGRERCVTEFRQHLRPASGIGTEPHNIMTYEDAGTPAGLGLVINQLAAHAGSAGAIFNGFGLHVPSPSLMARR